jgi:hypothetical protein
MHGRAHAEPRSGRAQAPLIVLRLASTMRRRDGCADLLEGDADAQIGPPLEAQLVQRAGKHIL